jgi:carbonic anhydrase
MGTPVTGKSVAALIRFPALRSLHFKPEQLSDDDVNRLRESLSRTARRTRCNLSTSATIGSPPERRVGPSSRQINHLCEARMKLLNSRRMTGLGTVGCVAILLAGCGAPSAPDELSQDETANSQQVADPADPQATTATPTATEEQESAAASSPTLDDHHYLHVVEHPHVAQWGYGEDDGPRVWGELSPKYVLARTGQRQSPIDIARATPQQLPAIEFDYRSAPINLVYNGHTVQESEDGASRIEAAGKRWTLKQFHFHSPSEHTVDGEHFDMEMHLVHAASDGHLAVVGVLIREGAENPAFSPLWRYLPTEENRAVRPEVTIDAETLLPESRGYYQYDGSFTTPPCTEGVRWMVLTTPVELSREQIQAFQAVIHGNNRPVQPLNDRDVSASARRSARE